MPSISILTETELRTLVPLDAEAVDCVEHAFRTLATADVIMPPIMSFEIPEKHGEVDVKTAYVPGVASFAIKMSPGFFDNPKLGLPSLNGLMVAFSSDTGLVEAVLLDNGYLTDVRTAAAGAVAAKHLAREDAHVATIFGAGVQAGLQLKALTLVRPITEARIWARRVDAAAGTARAAADALGIPVHAVAGPRQAMAGADIVVTTTPASQPILEAEWLEPGQHLTAMGSDAPHKCEIAPTAVTTVDLYVPDRLQQVRERGELRSAVAAGVVRADTVFAELGAVIAGQAAGRSSPEAITYADLTGTGIQDTAIAALASKRAGETGAGTQIES